MQKTNLIFILFLSGFLFFSPAIFSQQSQKKAIEEGNRLLDLAYSYIGKNTDSIHYLTSKAMAIGQQEKNIRIQSRSYAILAEDFQQHSKFKESVEYYLKSIDLSEKNNEKKTLSSTYNGIGITYYYLNDFKKSNYYIQKSLELNLELENYVNYSIISMNLSSLLLHKGEYRKAVNTLFDAEKVLLQYQEEKYLPSLYNSLGGNYRMLQQLDSARYFYEKSLDYAQKYKVQDNIITAFFNLGEMEMQYKRYEKAIFYLQKAKEKNTTNKIFNLQIYATLSDAYQKLGDYKQAFLFKDKQLELNKVIFESDKLKAIDELQIKYETAKNERELQKQLKIAQDSELKIEKERNKYILTLAILICIFMLVFFIVLFLWKNKQAQQKMEKEKLHLFENIVHEIRTPLSMIYAPIQEIRNTLPPQNKSLNELIMLIEKNTTRLIKLVNELLDTSKIEKGKYTTVYEYGAINKIIANIISSIQNEADRKHISIFFSPLASQLTYSLPINVIEKIISNLLSNAVKYCPNYSKVSVLVTLQENNLIIQVCDNGNGIPEQEQKQIFQRFYRMKAHHHYEGTGIGLSLVKELVHLIKGTLSLKSKQGEDTVFTVSIPLDLEDTSVEAMNITEVDDHKPYLLLVEDNADIVSFISNLVQKEYNVLVATNGEEGINKVHQFVPDIILTDVMMPIKDGVELLKEVKSNELTNHIPVVILSAKASIESKLEGLKYGADAYLIKPFNTEELQYTLQNLLTTNQNKQKNYQEDLKQNKTFEERLKNENDYVNRIVLFITKNIDDESYSVNELASDMCISRSQLHRKIKALTGFSSTNFIRIVRLEKAKDMLEANVGNVTEVAYSCGFSNPSYFTKTFTEYFGKNPSSFF